MRSAAACPTKPWYSREYRTRITGVKIFTGIIDQIIEQARPTPEVRNEINKANDREELIIKNSTLIIKKCLHLPI